MSKSNVLLTLLILNHAYSKTFNISAESFGSNNKKYYGGFGSKTTDEFKERNQGCALTLSLSQPQYDDICPMHELANLRKQIHDIKRSVQNNTFTVNEIISVMRKHTDGMDILKANFEAIETQFAQLQNQLSSAQEIIVNFSRIAERAAPVISALESHAAPPRDKEAKPNTGVNRLSAKLYGDLQQRIKQLELSYMRQQHVPIPGNCNNYKRAGIYQIWAAEGPAPISVFCRKGWTVISRRMDGSVNFFRGWDDYKYGFGNLTGEYWLGNENVHFITNQGYYKLRIEARDWNDTFYWASYKRFRIRGEEKRFSLHVSGHSGTLKNALYSDKKDSKFNHNGMAFSTYDTDNDMSSANCAMLYGGGYWYNDCYISNLNGPYCDAEENHSKCMVWWGKNGRLVLKEFTLMIKELP